MEKKTSNNPSIGIEAGQTLLSSLSRSFSLRSSLLRARSRVAAWSEDAADEDAFPGLTKTGEVNMRFLSFSPASGCMAIGGRGYGRGGKIGGEPADVEEEANSWLLWRRNRRREPFKLRTESSSVSLSSLSPASMRPSLYRPKTRRPSGPMPSLSKTFREAVNSAFIARRLSLKPPKSLRFRACVLILRSSESWVALASRRRSLSLSGSSMSTRRAQAAQTRKKPQERDDHPRFFFPVYCFL